MARSLSLRTAILVATLFAYSTYADDELDRRGGGAGEFVVTQTARLREEPSTHSPAVATLRRGMIVQAVGVSNGWYRIRSSRPGRPDGYVRRDLVEPRRGGGETRALSFQPGRYQVTQLTAVHRKPSSRSPKVVDLRTGAKVYVTDRTGAWYRIESEKGDRPPGYILAKAAKPLTE